MKILGIDYGTKYIGIALSDEGAQFAFPKGVILNDTDLFLRIAEFTQQEKISKIIVGDARTILGASNSITNEVELFAQVVREKTGIPVELFREAFSSAEAMRFAPPRARHSDSAAAAIILQRYLDSHPAVQ